MALSLDRLYIARSVVLLRSSKLGGPPISLCLCLTPLPPACPHTHPQGAARRRHPRRRHHSFPAPCFSCLGPHPSVVLLWFARTPSPIARGRRPPTKSRRPQAQAAARPSPAPAPPPSAAAAVQSPPAQSQAEAPLVHGPPRRRRRRARHERRRWWWGKHPPHGTQGQQQHHHHYK